MVEVFNQGAFSSYRIEDSRYSGVVTESRSFSAGTRRPTKRTIFLSHKHDDLEDLKGFIGYLERYYTVECYIDSEDPGMPEKTSGVTAERIKKFIKSTDRFILLATDNAIASKWCNWELGYGDAQKYKDRIAILPIKNTGREIYSGNEYMQIYPHIVRVDSSDISRAGLTYPIKFPLTPGYYVVSVDSAGKMTYVSLREWINK